MLHIVRGLPGSGKSTFAKSKLFAGMLVIELEQFWINADGEYKPDPDRLKDADQYMLRMLSLAMDQKVNTVVTGNFLTNKSIEPIIALCKDKGCNITIWRTVDEYPRTHGQSDATYAAMAKEFEDLVFPENIVSAMDPPYQIVTKTPGKLTKKENKKDEHTEETKR
jgi:adenylate kinase family enzyme